MKTKNEKRISKNKKRFLTGSVVIMALAFVLIGSFYTACNKEEPSVTNRLFNSKNLVEEPVFPNNPANYMDSVGIYHNEILSQARTMQRSGSRQDMYTLVDDCFRAKFPTRSQGVTALSRTEIQRMIADTAALFYHVIDEFNLSSQSKTFLNSLFYDLQNSQIYDYKYLKSVIVEYENNLLNQRSERLSNANWTSRNQEVDILLSVTSTLRHSLYYWEQEMEITTPGGIETARGRFWKWLTISIFDGVGAAGGLIAGGLWGGILGGVACSGGIASLF